MNPTDQAVCSELRNELKSSGLLDQIEPAIKGEQIPAIAFATPIDNYVRVSPGAASPEVADAVIAMNKAVAVLEGDPFTLWTKEQMNALGTAYIAYVGACNVF